VSEIKVRKKDIQEAKRPDAVLERAGTVFEWTLKNRKPLLGGLAALAVVIVGISLASASASSRRHELGTKLSAAVEDLDRPVGPATGEDKGEKTFATKEDRQKAVDQAFGDLLKEHADSAVGAAARLQVARSALQAGKPDEAIANLESYLSGSDQTLRLFAQENLGYAYEAKGDLEKAKAAFQRLADAGAPALALYHQARLAEKAGKKDEARAQYERVVHDFEKEAVAYEARGRLDLLDLPEPGKGALEEKTEEPAPTKAKARTPKARKGSK